MTACVGLVDRDCVYGKRIHTDGVTKKGDPKNYQDRLRTFRLDPQPWPLLCPSPEDLAKAGFIYTGQGTRVNCPSCGIYVEDWSDSTVDPVRKHYTRNTRCGFLHTHHAQRVHDFSIDSQYSGASLRLNDTSMRLNDTSMRLPDYSATEVRLSSFKNWTKDVIGSKEELAEAGLYLVEQPDVLRCYACRVELKDWVPGDTAVGKHLKKSPHCSVAGQQLSLGYTPRVSIYPLDTTPNLSVPTSDLQKQRPLASEGRLYTNPSDLSRRHSDRSVYLPPSYTVSAPPHFAHANSYEPMAQATPQWTGSVLCSGDIRTDSPSPRWMLDAGVDIRLPPSLDVKRRSTQSYTVGPPTSTLRNTVPIYFFLGGGVIVYCSVCLFDVPAFSIPHAVGDTCLHPAHCAHTSPHHTPFPITSQCNVAIGNGWPHCWRRQCPR